MATVIVGGILVIAVGLIIGYMIRRKKKGKTIGCSCGCDHCSGGCH